MVKVVIIGMLGYDVLYKWLIDGMDLECVIGVFLMEMIF